MYTNDRKAPRMKKGEFSYNVVSKKLWKDFRKTYPEYKGMKWNDFYKYWGDIAQTIREETITNPLGVKLGSYTGELKLQYMGAQFKGVDKSTSEELEKEVNHLNLMTRGKVATIKWERRWAVKFNKMLQFFAFEATREMNKMAKLHTDSNPEKLRSTRATTGGYSIWRQIRGKKL